MTNWYEVLTRSQIDHMDEVGIRDPDDFCELRRKQKEFAQKLNVQELCWGCADIENILLVNGLILLEDVVINV